MNRNRMLVLIAVIALALAALALAQRNNLFTDDDQVTAQNLWNFLENQTYEYAWAYIPGTAAFYEGTVPHGAVLRTFVNPIAMASIQASAGDFAPGSIIVKENHITGHLTNNSEEVKVTPEILQNFEGNLESVTVMAKVIGYNPEAGDWFWAKYQADGSIQAAGAVAGCIGCHSDVADQDYVYTVDVAGDSQ